MYLNCHSWFSFKYGTLSVEKLLTLAQHNGIEKLVLTDINNTSGVLDFVRKAPNYNVQPVVGIDFRNGWQQLFIGIAKNNEGFRELNDFLSPHLCTDNKINIPSIAPDFHHVYIIYPFGSNIIQPLKENEFIGVKPSDLNKLLITGWKYPSHKLVILQPVTFETKKDFNAHRLLRAIDKNTLLSKLPKIEEAQPDEVMTGKEDLSALYARFPYIIENTQRLLNNCSVYFEYGKSKNKKYFTGSAATDRTLLLEECRKGLSYRYGNPSKSVLDRLDKEIGMIEEKDFSSYFLINWEIVNYALHKNYFYIGRGSGANSLVAYLLRITDVDPIDLDLYFERFINPSRINPPDFDIDFSWKDRDDIIKHIFDRYKNTHTSLLATYSTFQSNAVVRELGKVFGLPKAEIDALQDDIIPYDAKRDHITNLIYNYSRHISDFPNHLSIHAGGILISEEPIHAYTATTMPHKGFPLTQFSMLEAEDVGLYKFDILSQRGLGHIKDTVEIVKQNRGIEIDIHNIKEFKEDIEIKNRLREARCIGCFYVESPAMRMLLKKLEADTYLGLVAASSIIRPGVAKSGMMREYILRFRDPKRRDYIHPLMKELMEETYGIMVYQEDVIKVAHHFAGLTLAEADMLRRGMGGKFRARDEFRKIEDTFFSNCKAKGYEDTLTKEVWRQIESFAGYAFSKGHSASYAVESYQSLFLKSYYPKEFMVGVINNFGGFYHAEYYIHEARMSGAHVNAPDINRSQPDTCIDGDEIYLGINLLADLEKQLAEAIVAERDTNGPFLSLENFSRRVAISLEQIKILIRIGAFRFTGRTKQQLLWDIHLLMNGKKTEPKKELFPVENKKMELPELFHHSIYDAWDEIEILGYPLCSPFSILKVQANAGLRAADIHLYLGKVIEIVGYYVTRKNTRTVKGDNMMFSTFIDREGYFIDGTHFPQVTRMYPFNGKGCYLVRGKVAEEFGFYSIEVNEMYRLDYITRDDVVKKVLAEEDEVITGSSQ